ncbi:unnamed protein product [Pleuronectes platessa]|uniref:Uncharacterized protein n=1 Tax=Pleuronectes platessa TaxID=8262 RepID=A0A9N7TM03_PLEPL|nr:unnamed protein product [Pleuronectes platessa]
MLKKKRKRKRGIVHEPGDMEYGTETQKEEKKDRGASQREKRELVGSRRAGTRSQRSPETRAQLTVEEIQSSHSTQMTGNEGKTGGDTERKLGGDGMKGKKQIEG